MSEPSRVSHAYVDALGTPRSASPETVAQLEALLDDSKLLAQGLSRSGSSAELTVYPGMWHVWQTFVGRFREANESIAALGQFLKRHFHH